jgi:hypothetical protein
MKNIGFYERTRDNTTMSWIANEINGSAMVAKGK